MYENLKSLSQLQEYSSLKARERGFGDETAKDTLLLMTEELGELARAVRRHSGIKSSDKSKIYTIEEELADLLIYLFRMADIFDVSLEEAFWKKEAENNKRVWK